MVEACDNDPARRPVVSVCIFAYNHGSYIEQALDGILAQKTRFAYEVCLGEDESSDRTRTLCQAYAERYPDKIRLFLRRRADVIYYEGHPTGRYNFTETLKAATGKYIAMCDGDDYWTCPDKLQKQVEFLESHRDFAVCFTACKKLQGHRLKPINTHVPGEVTGLGDLVRRNYIPTATIVFRNHLSDDFYRFYPKLPYMDHALFCYAAQFGKIEYFNEVMSVYRMHAGGVWSARSTADRLRHRTIVRGVIAEMLRERFPAESALALQSNASDFLRLAELHYRDGQRDLAAEYIAKALDADPATTTGRLIDPKAAISHQLKGMAKRVSVAVRSLVSPKR